MSLTEFPKSTLPTRSALWKSFPQLCKCGQDSGLQHRLLLLSPSNDQLRPFFYGVFTPFGSDEDHFPACAANRLARIESSRFIGIQSTGVQFLAHLNSLLGVPENEAKAYEDPVRKGEAPLRSPSSGVLRAAFSLRVRRREREGRKQSTHYVPRNCSCFHNGSACRGFVACTKG